MRRPLIVTTILSLSMSQASAMPALNVVYLDPATPEQSIFRVDGWPSFLFMPGAPVWLANKRRTGGAGVQVMGGDLDCADMAGPVFVGSNDPNRLDGDGDGIGCE